MTKIKENNKIKTYKLTDEEEMREREIRPVL